MYSTCAEDATGSVVVCDPLENGIPKTVTILFYALQAPTHSHGSYGAVGLRIAESSAIHAQCLDREDELVVGI